jgi:hypothetical protein
LSYERANGSPGTRTLFPSLKGWYIAEMFATPERRERELNSQRCDPRSFSGRVALPRSDLSMLRRPWVSNPALQFFGLSQRPRLLGRPVCGVRASIPRISTLKVSCASRLHQRRMRGDRRDLNSHGLAPTSSTDLRVYPFRHDHHERRMEESNFRWIAPDAFSKRTRQANIRVSSKVSPVRVERTTFASAGQRSIH